MKASEKIKDVHSICITISNWIGLQSAMTRNTPSLRFICVLLMGVVFMSMYLNSCYQNLNDTFKLVHALFPSAINSVLASRIFNLFYRKWYQYDPMTFKDILEFYTKYEKNPKYSKIMAMRANETEYYVKLIIYLTLLYFEAPIFMSLAHYFITGEPLLFINNYLPMTDPKIHFDFFLNIGLFVILMPVAAFGLLDIDSMLVFYGYQIIPFCDIICCHLDELTEDLEKLEAKFMDEQERGQRNRWAVVKEAQAKNRYDGKLMKLEKRFIDIVKEHRAMDQYIRTFIYFTEIPYFFTITLNSLSIALSIVIFFKISMPYGMIGFILFISQVIAPCLFGATIISQNKRIAYKLLDFPWFKMSRGKQKVFLQYIHLVQNATEFKMLVFGNTIDIEALSGVLNVSYSYFTFFLKVFGGD